MATAQNVPTVTIELDKPRRIAFTLGAMRRIKEKTGHGVGDEGADLSAEIGVYIWAMLVEEDRKDITVEQVEDMIWPGNVGQFQLAFAKAAGEGVPEGKAEAVPVEAASPQA